MPVATVELNINGQHPDPTLPQLVVLVVKGRGNSAPDVHWFPVAKYSLVNA